MNALHKKTNKFILDKLAVEVYNNTVNGAPLCGCSRWDKNLRKRGGHRCDSIKIPRETPFPASEWSILCVSARPDGAGYSFFSIVCSADDGIFIPIFQLA